MSASPPVRPGQILRSPVHFLAFGLGTGLSPAAPGTVGTLLGIPLFLALQPLTLPLYLAVTAFLFVLGCYLCGESARRLGVHDHGGIVFDEIVAFQIAVVPLLTALPRAESIPTWIWLSLGFALFRLFDILKPPPIDLADERLQGGFGIMLDDLVAALYAAALLALAMWLSPNWVT